jgi:protein-tyrosine phosphatase
MIPGLSVIREQSREANTISLYDLVVLAVVDTAVMRILCSRAHGPVSSRNCSPIRRFSGEGTLKQQAVVSLWAGLTAIAAVLVGLNLTASAQASGGPGTSLGIASVPNLRDVGGYTTQDGSAVRRGVVYRSDQLNPVTPDDMKKLAALGLRKDFDLRTAAERQKRPDQLPPGVEEVWLNVLADAEGSGPAGIEKLLSNPKEANKVLGDGKAAEEFVKAYRQFITLPSAKASFHKLFVGLGEEGQVPSLYHCTTGKDRTGWATAALLTLLGVPKDEVYVDYLRSNDYILPAYKKFIDHFVAEGGDPSIPPNILGVKTEYLQASFDEVTSQYGSIEGYFEKGLGIDKAGQQRLRDRFLTVAGK